MKDLIEAVKIAADFSERVRRTYAHTKEWTSNGAESCETIRVPVALLNRVRDAWVEVEAEVRRDSELRSGRLRSRKPPDFVR